MTGYFKNYLKVAPLGLAIWRANEAQVLKKASFPRPLLDIGCGFGEFAGAFFEKPVEYGIDISSTDITQAKDTGKYLNLIQADGMKLPFKGHSFKGILSMSVLEHINDPEKVMSEAFRVLKPGGEFVFSVPTTQLNKHSLFVQLLIHLKAKPVADYYLKTYHHIFKHQVLQSKKWWLSKASNAGFEVVSCEPSLSARQLHFFEILLPFSIPSQLYRLLTGKRGITPFPFRMKLLSKMEKSLVSPEEYTDINIVVICRKPL